MLSMSYDYHFQQSFHCQIQISENNKSCCSKNNNNIINIKQEEEQKVVVFKTNMTEQNSKMKAN